MLWRKKVLRISAAVIVAAAAAHTAESLKGQRAQQSLLLATAQGLRADQATVLPAPQGDVPASAAMSSRSDSPLGEVVRITSVSGTMQPAGGDHCQPSMQLAAVAGGMIHLSLFAPCNRNERILVRHSGLSFGARTEADGAATLLIPALKPDATVAVYLPDAHLVLGKVTVPDAASYTRFAIMWDWPADVGLRVIDGDKVLIGTAPGLPGEPERVMALGSTDVQSPALANVYSVPGNGLGDADLTGELRITPASCGRTLRLQTVYSAAGVVSQKEQSVAVPLCGTAGDILLLKNLAPDLTLATPR